MSKIEPTPYSTDYEITDAMFGAFRTAGGMSFFWKLTGWATLFYTVLFLAMIPPIVRAYGDLLIVAADVNSEATAAMFRTMFSVFGSLILFSIAAFLIQAIVRAAFYRGYFDGEIGGVFPFQFGGDEVRQSLSILGYYGIVFLFLFVATFVVGFAAGLVAVLSGDAGGAVAVILIILGYFALTVGYIWIMTKYAPAGALTAWRGQTHVLAARHVTNGRFWAIFGSVLVAGLIGYVAYSVLASIGMVVGFAGVFSGDVLAALLSETPEDVVPAMIEQTKTSGFMVGVIFAAILTSLGSAIYMVMIAGPQAFFTYQWAEASPDFLAEE